MTDKFYQIAVDGFSSCGKSTLARQLASELGYTYIDSGAMYRAATLLALEKRCVQNGKLMVDCFQVAMKNAKVGFSKQDNRLILNGVDVEDEIRQPIIAEHVSEVASHGFVREILMEMQRNYSNNASVVMDGRDIGTHVFPSAIVKLFITAEPKIRAQRRFLELQDKGVETTFEEVLNNVEKRDKLDQNRTIAPLRKASDAIEIDNSHLTREGQLNKALGIIRTHISEVL